MLRSAAFPWEDGEPLPTLYRAVGCSACSKTGYRGRLALHEVMAVVRGDRAAGGRRARRRSRSAGSPVEQGMLTLRLDGMDKVRAGVTSIEEILRVVV